MKKLITSFILIMAFTLSSFTVAAYSKIIGPRLKFITIVHKSKQGHLFKLPANSAIPVVLKFQNPVNLNVITKSLPAGMELYSIDGRILHSNHVIIATADLEKVTSKQLAQIPGLVEVETLWRPQQMLPLYYSRPQIQADQLWEKLDHKGDNLTGKGILIADLDTGINLFHPAFYFADGDTFSWIDVNNNTMFDAGVDGIDLNKNEVFDSGEVLNFINAQVPLANPTYYNPSLDWLYNDANNDSKRNYSPVDGFQESDPTYGEPIYVVVDENLNDKLDIDEKLIALGTCKVRKVFQSNGTIVTRGIDLITNEGDSYGHGTPVCGIMAGGIAGIHQMAGIAPGAELLMGVNVYIADPPFIQTMEILAPWAVNEGAHIIIYEDGEWIWQYMDGSSAMELMINDFAAQGVVQVVPAGNLAGGGMHTSDRIAGQDSTKVPFSVVYESSQKTIWGDFLWQGDSSALTFDLEYQDGTRQHVPGDGEFYELSNYKIYSFQSRSTRGTNRLDFMIVPGDANSIRGNFTFTLRNLKDNEHRFHAYIWDDKSSWNGNTRWVAANDDGTITWPATADSAITVAAYDPQNSQQPLNDYSGQGARVDGKIIMDIAAPGSNLSSTSRSSSTYYAGYSNFSGTSAAGPFVAGAAALLVQYLRNDPAAPGDICYHETVKKYMRKGAGTENIHNPLPDNNWGFGRLRIFDAYEMYRNENSTTMPGIPISLPENFNLAIAPNPFNSHTMVYVKLLEAADIKIEIYNLLGQKVKTVFRGNQQPGIHKIAWNGRDQLENELAIGVYFVCLKVGNRFITHKIALLR